MLDKTTKEAYLIDAAFKLSTCHRARELVAE
jgi:hypothetical protein